MAMKQLLTKVGVVGGIAVIGLSGQMAFATPNPDDVYVSTLGNDSSACSIFAPCATINRALSVASDGGTVHVASGTYTQDITIHRDNVTITGGGVSNTTVGFNNTGSNGVDIENAGGIVIKNINFKVQPTGSTINYALHAYQSHDITLQNNNFIGSGKTNTTPKKVGGVDINSSQNVTIQNVEATDFSKNGFSVTARYTTEDTPTSNVTLDQITAMNNAWNGVAFYTIGNDPGRRARAHQ